MKILFVSNTANFSKFNKPYMVWCKNKGWIVDYCAPDDETIDNCDNHIVLPIPRSPFSLSILSCISNLRKIIEKENYDIIHCHTPVGAVVARLAAKKLIKQKKTKLIYTAHGFHFYKGAPLKYWLFFYPVEKYLSRYTDVLITINNEDYELAKKRFKIEQIFYFDGIGVDINKYTPVESEDKKTELRVSKGFNENDFIILYTAEFIKRKNHQLIFNILPELKRLIPNLKIVLAGKGELLQFYQDYVIKNNLSEFVIFLGYSKEISLYCKISDLLLMPSFQEGLPIAMIEAIATGLPVVASKIRGHTDVIKTGDNGRLCCINDEKSFLNAIYELYSDIDLRKRIGLNNIERAKIYSMELAVTKMAEIYLSCVKDSK